MTLSERWKSFAPVICCLVFVGIDGALPQTTTHPASNKGQRDRIVFSHLMPRLNGDNLKVTIVEVTYGPGESSKAHTHPCPVIGYVLEGSLRMKVKDEPEAIYKAGETFYEAPSGIHQMSANASQTKPAKFIAYFVCDHETPLSIAPLSM